MRCLGGELRRFSLFILWMGSVQVAQADCQTSTSTADLVVGLSAAEAAFVALDIDAFQSAVAQAERDFACIREPLTPIDASAYHRVIALDAYVRQDPDTVAAAFRGALNAQPGYTLPSSLAPPGNPLMEAFDSARVLGPTQLELVPVPSGTAIFVDGRPAEERSSEVPAVLQLVAADGRVVWTGRLAPGVVPDRWADFAVAQSDAHGASAREKSVSRLRPPLQRTLVWSAGGAALASGAAFALAHRSRAQFDDPTTPVDELESLREQTNSRVIVSGGFGVMAMGLWTAGVWVSTDF